MLAAQTTEQIEKVDPLRPLTDAVVRWLDLDPSGPVAAVLEWVVEPIVWILTVCVVAAVVLWVVRRAGGRLARRVAARLETDSARNAQRVTTLASIGSSILGVVVWSTALLVILSSVFGINLGPVLAGAGIVGIAIGFGAQTLIGDMIAGMFIMLEDTYGVGDVIEVGEASGTVEHLGIRTTRIRDASGTLWHIPNGEIRLVGNMSQEWSNAVLDIPIHYAADVDKAIEVIRAEASEAATSGPKRDLFLGEPRVLGVQSIHADRIVIRMTVKTKAGEQWGLGRDLRKRIKEALDRAGIAPPPFAPRWSDPADPPQA